jgi:hypothetical protein
VCLARDPLVAPLGFTLLGSPARALAGFRPTSSHALEPFGPAPRSINRPLPEPVRFLRQAAEGEQATPFRVSHHAGSQPFEPATSELLVHFAQPEHITVPRLHSLNAVKALPELLGSASGADGFLRPAEAPGTFGPFAQTPALLICGPGGPTEPDCVSIK